MKYVTQLGAYGLTVAAAFAVALAVLVSVSSTPTAEAAAVDLPAADRAVTVAPGDTVNIVVDDTFALVTITDTAEGVGASFAAGGQAVSCSDGTACDTDDSDANTPGKQNVYDSLTVVLNVDDDSGEGHILLSVSGIGSTNTDLTKVITVSKAGLVGSLEIKTDAAADKTVTANAGVSNLTVTVKNASTPAGGLATQTVSVITTHGTVGCGSGAGSASAGNSQTCSAATDAAGVVDVILTGGGVEGTATVTATLGSFADSADVTLFGTAKNLAAEPEQGSIEIGGSVFIVLTVTDDAGNPVAGQVVSPVSTPAKEVEGPEDVDKPVLVVTEQDTDIPTPAVGDTAAGRGYSKDKPAVGSAAAIPACGDDNLDTDTTASGLQELFGPNDGTADAAAVGTTAEGTNAKGQCVVYVTAPEDTSDATKNATRGVHTLNFAIGTIKASTTIEVAGKPASISTSVDDDPSVEPETVTKITVSVFDDEAVLVGVTDVKIRKVGGDGLIEDAGTSTTNGQTKFTFIAPSSAGSSEILITAGTVNHRVTLNIGEAMPEEPAMPEEDEHAGEPTLTLQGSLGSFSGGSVDDLAHAAEHECPGGATIYVQMADGGWGSPYVTDAVVDLVNTTFSARFPDGLASPTFVAVTRCEADAMASEGNGMEENGG